MNEKLMQGLEKIGLEFSDNQKQQLEKYISCVLKFNESYNLMKADSEDEMAISHVLDSLVAVPHLKSLINELNPDGSKEDFKIGDIGSGGGCPGIPLSIAFPEYNFCLVERMEKRCMFLQSTIKELGLLNVKIMNVQADLVPGESFDIEVFRAFHPFDKKIGKLLLRMLKKGGYIAAYKARDEKIQAEMEEVKMMIPEYKKIPMVVPFLEDHQRNLVVVKK